MDDFLLSIQANNYSPETLYNYERDLDTFAHFLTNEMNNLPFPKITKRTIEQFKAYLNSPDRLTANGEESEKRLSSGSINRNLTSIRRYLTYLIDMDYDCPVVPGSIKLLRMGKKHGQVAEMEDLIRLIEAPVQDSGLPGKTGQPPSCKATWRKSSMIFRLGKENQVRAFRS